MQAQHTGAEVDDATPEAGKELNLAENTDGADKTPNIGLSEVADMMPPSQKLRVLMTVQLTLILALCHPWFQ